MPRWLLSYGLLAGVGGVTGLAVWSEIDEVRSGEVVSWEAPWALFLLAAVPLLVWVGLHLRRARSPSFLFSQVSQLAAARPGLVARFVALPVVLRIVAVALIAVALARPQTFKKEIIKIEGIDIMMVLDLSKSMEERDLHRNRLDAGQRTIRQFLRKRQGKGDRIGLVVFAREAMMQCPLTLDYRALETIVANLAIGDVPEMGTAIGDALGLSLASLRRSKARSKVVILVSDGDSNVASQMDPQEAKDLAAAMGVRVFTVLMGEERSPSADRLGRDQYAVNPELLEGIARDTGGLYFNAGDDEALEQSFEQIRETLDKSELKVVGTSADLELFDRLLFPALMLLVLELLLRLTRWRSFP